MKAITIRNLLPEVVSTLIELQKRYLVQMPDTGKFEPVFLGPFLKDRQNILIAQIQWPTTGVLDQVPWFIEKYVCCFRTSIS
jgi:hypothetical protein